MITELTFAILKYGFLILLWVFVWLAVRSLHKDIEAFSPQPSRARRRRDKRAMKSSDGPAPSGPAAAQTAPVTPPRQSQQRTPQSGPTLLVIIDGPKAGASVPLTSESITLGRAASTPWCSTTNSSPRITPAYIRIPPLANGRSRIWEAPTAPSSTSSG